MKTTPDGASVEGRHQFFSDAGLLLKVALLLLVTLVVMALVPLGLIVFAHFLAVGAVLMFHATNWESQVAAGFMILLGLGGAIFSSRRLFLLGRKIFALFPRRA